MLRALIFDFDGLILDTETPLIDSYGDVYAADGVVFDRSEFLKQVGHAHYAFDPWKAFGPSADKVALEARRRVFSAERLQHQPLLPGVKELISEAHAGGLRLGLASNSTHEWVEGQLQTLGLHHYFSFFGCRGDTPAPKPEPDIYRHVANQLGCRPVEAVALEDSFAGVRAARRAGLWVVAIPNSSTTHHTLDEAHWELPSMAELSLAKLRARFEDK